MVSVSVFDLCVILFCCFGLCVALGAAYGRASVWREVALAQVEDEEPPVKPKRGLDVPPSGHKEDRRPPEVEQARGAVGPTRVVGRRREE